MKRPLLLATLALASACEPDIDDTTSIVRALTILAIQSDPAEVAPRGEVTYRALVADPEGKLSAIEWAFCNDRKPLAELGPASRRCFTVGKAEFLEPLGQGPEVAGELPELACRNFGPEVPPPKPDEPFGRPVDPDSTGGYYQPIRVVAEGRGQQELALGKTRISCGIAGVSSEISTAYAQRYKANQNPTLDRVEVAGAALVEDGPNELKAGAKVTLKAVWPECSLAPCAGAEPYVVYDPVARKLVDRRETLRVAWFAEGGSFDTDRTGRGADDETPFSENGWKVPSTRGTINLWVVLRDDRAGESWKSYVIDVR